MTDINQYKDIWCLKGEVWKDIVGYEGIYQASSLGRVRSLDREFYRKTDMEPYSKDGTILQQIINNKGYYVVTLYNSNHEAKIYSVHRIIALTFIKNDDPVNKIMINHKAEYDKRNNSIENLEWCTAKYNANYGTGAQRGACAMTATKQSQVPDVLQFKIDGTLVGRYSCCADAARKIGIPSCGINKCCLGQSSNSHGYIFRYDYEGFGIDDTKKIYIHKLEKVDCYLPDGTFVCTYNSPKEAGESIGGKNGAHISSCCNGNREIAYGYVWRRHGDPFDKHPAVGSWKKKLYKKVVQLSIDGEFIKEHKSVQDATKEVKRKYGILISNCLLGKRKEAYGYKWMYANEYYKNNNI